MSDAVGKSLTYVETDLDVHRITIFENEAIGVGLPRNWSLPASTAVTVSVVADADVPSGRAMRVQKTTGNRSVLSWTAVPSVRDVSAIGLFKSSVATSNMGIGLRMSGTDGLESGYALLFRSDVRVEIFKFVGGVPTSLVQTDFDHASSEALWLRFDALDVTGGVLLRGKAWRGEVTDEPESFTTSFTDVGTALPAGGDGLLVTSTNSPDFECGLFRARSLFSQSTETFRFTKSTAYLPRDIDAIPSLLEVQLSPGAISLGENLGERATLTAAFKDHKHADLGEMYDRGTFWGKFRARQLFRRGQPIRALQGLLGQSLAEMESRHYLLDSFSGPTFGGAFQLVGKDPLKLADDDRALAPRPSQGALTADITSSEETLTVTSGTGVTYSPSGYIAIGGKEVMGYVRGGNDELTKAMLQFSGADASTSFPDVNNGGTTIWTPHGNAQMDTASFAVGTSSLLCDGTGDYVDAPARTEFNLGSGDWTIECWFNCQAVSGALVFMAGQSDSAATASTLSFWIARETTNKIRVLGYTAAGATQWLVNTANNYTNLVNPGWHHLAVVRFNDQIYLYVDGLLDQGTTTQPTGTHVASVNNFSIGRLGELTTQTWNGWIDEFRMSVGVARYTSTFTPPAAHVWDSYTKILHHFEGADASVVFNDDATIGYARTWTANGNAQVDTADFRLGGSSGLFDGTGDYVDTPDHYDFTLGSQNFAIDFWFKCNAASGTTQRLAGQNDSGFTTASVAFSIFRNSSDQMVARVGDGLVLTAVTSTSIFTSSTNTGWHHLAFVRSGDVLKLFIDGVQEGGDVAFTGSVLDSANRLAIGRQGEEVPPGSGGWIGWIDSFRFSVGSARWTANFAPVGPYSTSNDTFGINGQRGLFGTTAIAHSAEDRVQECLYYSSQSPATIIDDLFVNYADVDQSFISLPTWETEVDTFLDRLYTKMIADPTGVNELASNLIKQAGLAVWWDPKEEQIRLQVLRGVSTDAFTYDQQNILAGSISVGEQPEKQITQCWTYYGVRNPLVPLDQQDNYRSGLVTVNLEAELLNGSAVIKTIYADWIPSFGRTTAERVNDLQIGRFVVPPRRVAFDVMRNSGVEEPQLGGGYNLEYWGAQNEFGDQDHIPFQVTRLNPMADRFRVEGEEMLFTQQSAADLTNRVILFDSNVNNVNLKSVHDSIYPALTDADVTAGVTLSVIIGNGVIIGSASTSNPAFNVGTGWPVGMPISIDFQTGRVEGKGGRGGEGGYVFTNGGLGGDGHDGGTALFARFPVSILVSLGDIFGGGGGGGGGGSGGVPNAGGGGGGGGGAGQTPTDGGVGGPGSGSASPGTAGGTSDEDTGGDGGSGGAGTNPGAPGGDGGGPGLAGAAGTDSAATGGSPGSPGTAVDGISFVTVAEGPGDIRGAQIN